MCSTVISQLGFECHPIGKTLRIISPFTYCDDGEHVGAFIREVNGRYLVSDRCDALMNMEARGISLTKNDLMRYDNYCLKKAQNSMLEEKSLLGQQKRMSVRLHRT